MTAPSAATQTCGASKLTSLHARILHRLATEPGARIVTWETDRGYEGIVHARWEGAACPTCGHGQPLGPLPALAIFRTVEAGLLSDKVYAADGVFTAKSITPAGHKALAERPVKGAASGKGDDDGRTPNRRSAPKKPAQNAASDEG